MSFTFTTKPSPPATDGNIRPGFGTSVGNTTSFTCATGLGSSTTLCNSSNPQYNFGAPTTNSTATGGLFGSINTTTGLPSQTNLSSMGISQGPSPSLGTSCTVNSFLPSNSQGVQSSTLQANSLVTAKPSCTISSTPGITFSATNNSLGTLAQPVSFSAVSSGCTTSASSVNTHTATTFVGLGGITSSCTAKLEDSTVQNINFPLDKPVPIEVQHLVNQLRVHINLTKKQIRLDGQPFTSNAYCLIEVHLNELIQRLNFSETRIMNNCNWTTKILTDLNFYNKHLEMAQITQDTPPNQQVFSDTPLIYFRNLTQTYEMETQQLTAKLHQIKQLFGEKLCNLTTGYDDSLHSSTIWDGLSNINKTIMNLAGRLQMLHEMVEKTKAQYRTIYKQTQKTNDTNNLGTVTNEHASVSDPFEHITQNWLQRDIVQFNSLKVAENFKYLHNKIFNKSGSNMRM